MSENDVVSTQKRGLIPEEAIKASEEARDPMVRDDKGKVVRAKNYFRENGDPCAEDRVSLEKSEIAEDTNPDANIQPG